MAWDTIYNFEPGATGQQIVLADYPKPKFSQIITGEPLHYHGSNLQLEETLTLITEIVNPQLVDSYDQWPITKYKLGNWQRLTTAGLPIADTDSSGFINYKVSQFTHHSYYTITANPNNKATIGEYARLGLCNLKIDPKAPPIPISNLSIESLTRFDIELRSEASRTPSTLADTEYIPWFSGMAFFVFPGVTLKRIELSVSIINDIYTADEEFESVVCNLGIPTCNEEFNSFIYSSNGDKLIDDTSGRYFSSLATYARFLDSIGLGNIAIPPITYTCKNGGERIYYLVPPYDIVSG